LPRITGRDVVVTIGPRLRSRQAGCSASARCARRVRLTRGSLWTVRCDSVGAVRRLHGRPRDFLPSYVTRVAIGSPAPCADEWRAQLGREAHTCGGREFSRSDDWRCVFRPAMHFVVGPQTRAEARRLRLFVGVGPGPESSGAEDLVTFSSKWRKGKCGCIGGLIFGRIVSWHAGVMSSERLVDTSREPGFRPETRQTPGGLCGAAYTRGTFNSA